jgi:hypothetical protein
MSHHCLLWGWLYLSCKSGNKNIPQHTARRQPTAGCSQGSGTYLEGPAGALVVLPVLFLVLLATVRHQFAGATPVGRGTGTHVAHSFRHRSGK